MDFPPSKRLKGHPGSAGPDPFDDDLDFTQEDLDQIDILASQAVSADVQSGSKRAFASVFTHEPSRARAGRMTFALGDANNSKDTSVDGRPSGDAGDLSFSQLEEQQTALRRKLKEVEDEILMKNGEIRVLRDSLRLAHQEKEHQRLARLAQDQARDQAQSEREKELTRKVQSLQSELSFKEAEMIQMRGKIQSAERGKQPSTPARNTVQSPASRAFMTKEHFSADLSRKSSPLREGLPAEDERPDQSQRVPAGGIRSERQQEGCVLLSLLLQQPLDPSSLGLCHLMSIGPIGPIGRPQSPEASLGTSSSSTADLHHRPPALVLQLQSLAMSGLTALSLQPSSRVLQPCPAAVHFLPLLALHIRSFCQSLESAESSAKASLHSSSRSGCSESGLEESLGGQEELALAAITALYHILSHSDEALEAVLSHPDGEIGPERPQGPKSLLSGLLQLADPAFITSAVQKGALMDTSVRTICKLAERAQDSQLLRLQVVMSGQALSKCLTLETSYRIVHLSVRFLSFIIYNEEMATKLCSHEYPCPFLKIFQYVTSRPDKSASEDMWSRLELEVIRFLTMLFTQKAKTWAAFCESSCQCINEVVRTVVLVLHRQWLRTRGRGNLSWTAPGPQALRDALMLLHWLLLRDSSFSDHCLDVLHMYDQAIPAIRDTFRLIPDLSESEELALEEICRSETEYVEDVDMETGS